MYSFGQLRHCLIISNNILHYLALFDIVKHRVGNSIFRSFLSLKKNDSDRIDLVDLLKRSTMIESLSSIFEKDWGERFDLFKYRIYLLITKNDRFDQKTDDRNPNPGKTLYSTLSIKIYYITGYLLRPDSDLVYTDYYVDRLTVSVTNGLTTKTAMLGIALPIGKREGGGKVL